MLLALQLQGIFCLIKKINLTFKINLGASRDIDDDVWVHISFSCLGVYLFYCEAPEMSCGQQHYLIMTKITFLLELKTLKVWTQRETTWIMDLMIFDLNWQRHAFSAKWKSSFWGHEFKSVFLSAHLQAVIAQHDRHCDEQQLGSLGVQRQAEDAC